MKLKLPESSFLDPLHKVEGTPKEARASFYELAKNRIKYLTRKETRKWHKDIIGKRKDKTAAAVFNYGRDDNFEKWITNLEIIVNKDAFNLDDEDYSNLMPFVIEHEIYESWLFSKEGTASKTSQRKRHLLAKRREYLLAEQQGLGDRLFEWQMKLNPDSEDENEYALRIAKKQVGHLKEKK